MEEYLLDIDWILKEFIRRKYIVIQNSTFADWLAKYHRFNPEFHDAMSVGDRLYRSLYSYVSVIKPN